MAKKTRLIAVAAVVVCVALVVVGSIFFITHLDKPEVATTRLHIPVWILGIFMVVAGVWTLVLLWNQFRKGRV